METYKELKKRTNRLLKVWIDERNKYKNSLYDRIEFCANLMEKADNKELVILIREEMKEIKQNVFDIFSGEFAIEDGLTLKQKWENAVLKNKVLTAELPKQEQKLLREIQKPRKRKRK